MASFHQGEHNSLDYDKLLLDGQLRHKIEVANLGHGRTWRNPEISAPMEVAVVTTPSPTRHFLRHLLDCKRAKKCVNC